MPQLPDSAREMLRGKAYAHVVTRSAGGRSQITMVWADEIDGHLAFNTSRGRVKLRNIEREPQIAVTVQDPRDPQQYLVLQGHAEVLPEGGSEHIDRLAVRFLGLDHYPYCSRARSACGAGRRGSHQRPPPLGAGSARLIGSPQAL